MYSFGMRLDNDSNAITQIDEVEKTATTKGYVNGEYVEFGSGGSGALVVNFSEDDGVYAADKTLHEMNLAVNAGIPVIGKYGCDMFNLICILDDSASFLNMYSNLDGEDPGSMTILTLVESWFFINATEEEDTVKYMNATVAFGE